jgi:hypothetical protein
LKALKASSRKRVLQGKGFGWLWMALKSIEFDYKLKFFKKYETFFQLFLAIR